MTARSTPVASISARICSAHKPLGRCGGRCSPLGQGRSGRSASQRCTWASVMSISVSESQPMLAREDWRRNPAFVLVTQNGRKYSIAGISRVRPLTIAIGNHGLTKPLKDGSVQPDGLELQYLQVDPITSAMRRMVRDLEFDVCEMAFTTYLCAKAYGRPITATPVFITRNFHHRACFYRVGSGIQQPKDLEGRVVGVNRGYTVTTGTWARGILESEYGVDLRKITWAPTNDEHVTEFRAPSNVDYRFRGQTIAELFASGA